MPPVSKHGLRSYARLQAIEFKAHRRSESKKVQASLEIVTCVNLLTESSGINPKGGDLYVDKTKPVERLVEVCSSIDVQIIYPICVKGRKTHRTTK